MRCWRIGASSRPTDAVASRAWVALKHEITYRKPAFLEDDVIARTVLESTRGARAFYSHRDRTRRRSAGRSQVELVLHRCGKPETCPDRRGNHRLFQSARTGARIRAGRAEPAGGPRAAFRKWCQATISFAEMVFVASPPAKRNSQAAFGLGLALALVTSWLGLHLYSMLVFELTPATTPAALVMAAVLLLAVRWHFHCQP